jgi:hypothetical protein
VELPSLEEEEALVDHVAWDVEEDLVVQEDHLAVAGLLVGV